MVLIHDIVEIDAGDTFIYDSVKNHTNTDEETHRRKTYLRTFTSRTGRRIYCDLERI